MKNPFSALGIRSKFNLTIIIIAALTTLTVGGYLLYTVYTNLVDDAIIELSVSTRTNTQGINNFLNEEQQNVIFLSRLNSLENYIIAAESNDQVELEKAEHALIQDYFEFAQAHHIYDQIRYIDETGQEIVRINTSRDGVSTIVEKDKLQNKADRGYFTNTIVLGENETYISALDLNVENNQIETPYKPVIRYSVPVYYQGELKGIVITNILADNLLDILRNSDTPAFMVDKDGYYLFNPDESKAWGRDLKTEFTVAQDYPEFTNELLSGNSGNFNDDSWYYTYTSITLPGEDAPRWFIANQKPVGEVNTAANRALTIGFTLMAAMLALGAFGGTVVSNNLTAGLIDLTKIAEQTGAGNFDVQAKVTSQDEIGILATAFNNMTSRLQELISSLEFRVAERTKALTNVAEISTATSANQNLDEMLADFVHLTQRRFGLYHAHVFLYDETEEALRIIACGWKEGDEHEGTHGTTAIPIAQEQSLVARAARTRKPVTVNDVHNEPGWLPNPLLPDTKSEVAIPMIVGDRVIGVMDVQSDRLDAFAEADVDIQLTLSAQVAIAVQNILQIQNSQKIANDLGVVAQVGIATATLTDIGELLQEVVDLSKKSFNLYHAHIYTLNSAGDTLQLTAGAGEVGRQMVSEGRSIPLDSEKSLVARAARTQRGVVVNDVTEDPDFLPNSLLPDTRAEMAVPMLIGNRVIGVLDVQSETIGRFTEVDVNVKTTLASQIAVAMQNAQSFEESKRTAEREASVNLIGQRIQSTTSVENALQVVVRELGHALGMKSTSVSLETSTLAGKTKAVGDE